MAVVDQEHLGSLSVKLVHSFIHSFIHSLIYFCHKPEIQQQYTEIYNTLKIIYNILTKLFTRSYVESGNGKEAYVEAGDL